MPKYTEENYCPICEWEPDVNPNGGGLHGPCPGCGHQDTTWNTYLGDKPTPPSTSTDTLNLPSTKTNTPPPPSVPKHPLSFCQYTHKEIALKRICRITIHNILVPGSCYNVAFSVDPKETEKVFLLFETNSTLYYYIVQPGFSPPVLANNQAIIDYLTVYNPTLLKDLTDYFKALSVSAPTTP